MCDYLYLHVPFCSSICFYCDFCHLLYQPQKAEAWLTAVAQELQQKQISPQLKTIYIGGGTPTCLSADQLDRLLQLLDPYAARLQEYTIEINPETLDLAKAEILQKHGVSRASIGYQTSDPQQLQSMNRHHTVADVRQSMLFLNRCGIHNISLDIMYSLPGQDLTGLQKSVQDALQLQPTHLSLYSLMIEPGTVFARQGRKPCDPETEADMYEWICAELPRHGYQQYEISNFCQPGFASIHNCAYWNYRDFYGISMGASGKHGLVRYDNVRSLPAYLQNPGACTEIHLTAKDAMFEMLMMSLRLKKGMDLPLFQQTFHADFDQVFGSTAKRLITSGLLQRTDHHLRCTDRGYEILNDVLEEFLP